MVILSCACRIVSRRKGKFSLRDKKRFNIDVVSLSQSIKFPYIPFLSQVVLDLRHCAGPRSVTVQRKLKVDH